MWSDDIRGEIADTFEVLSGVPEMTTAFWAGMHVEHRAVARVDLAEEDRRQLRLRDRAWEARHVRKLDAREGVASTCPKCGARLEMRDGLKRPMHFGRCVKVVR